MCVCHLHTSYALVSLPHPQAEKHQKRSIKMILIFVLIVLVAAAVIGLVLYRVLKT